MKVKELKQMLENIADTVEVMAATDGCMASPAPIVEAFFIQKMGEYEDCYICFIEEV